ncbi:MAG: HEAT repeat domain-containing protein [Sedimentisphaerales bacterium]|nr:HEAT repeat domain-containing protein [Sedimentisphaerales bacterium]
MKTCLFYYILLIGFISFSAHSVHAADEQDLIAVLQSSAGAVEKCSACQQLRIFGTAKSVPVLAALLEAERVGHAARYALEGMPYPEAGAALRDALGTTSGLTKAGIIDSLGWRRDTAAVPLLAPLLTGTDLTLARASASALGRIGNEEAISCFRRAIINTNPEIKMAIMKALLQCAEEQMSAGDDSNAAKTYDFLLGTEVPSAIRSAAWRGLVMSDSNRRPGLIIEALKYNDSVALKVVREIKDEPMIKACLRQWDSLPAKAQLAVLDAHVPFGADALITVRIASTSSDEAVRIAAWRALALLGDTSLISALTRAAAHGEPLEKEAAREALARVHGPDVRETLLGYLNEAGTVEKIELLSALGQRGDTEAAPVLLQYANSAESPLRLAALEALRNLAVADTLQPLLDLAIVSKSPSDRTAILKTLHVVCRANSDKDQTGRRVITALNCLPGAERSFLLPLLAEIATVDALNEAQKASQDNDNQLVREAIRVLSQWPNAAPAKHLFEMARTHPNRSLRTLALRGGITVTGRESNPSARLALLREALSIPGRAEEKKLALSQLSQIPSANALDLALHYLDDPDLINEAGLAALTIAESLTKDTPQLADEVARKVLEHSQTPAIIKRAWALRAKPAAGGPFIRDWLVCGPYSRKGATGATTVFNLSFAPEKSGETAKWNTVPAGDTVNLAGLFPNRSNCVAYLKAEIIATETTDAILLMGSDDGIKAWLNGTVVHSNNVDRGQVVDQDMAPIKLKRGANELLLKVTQGGGGWSACARIVGPDGLPIKGLRVKSQTDAAP